MLRKFYNMVQRITQIIKHYQERVREMPCVPTTFLRRDSVPQPGCANKLCLTLFFSEHAIRIQFLTDVGLVRSKVQCNSCGRHSTWYADPSVLFSTRRYRKPLTAPETEVRNGFRSFL